MHRDCGYYNIYHNMDQEKDQEKRFYYHENSFDLPIPGEVELSQQEPLWSASQGNYVQGESKIYQQAGHQNFGQLGIFPRQPESGQSVPESDLLNSSPSLFSGTLTQSQSRSFDYQQIQPIAPQLSDSVLPYQNDSSLFQNQRNQSSNLESGNPQIPILRPTRRQGSPNTIPTQRPARRKADTKNLLINLRSMFADYIRHSIDRTKKQISPETQIFFQKFSSAKSVNRSDYQKLFKMEEFREIIEEMFRKRHLQRQFQLSRSSSEVRPVYLKKIRVLELAFVKKKLPRIC